MTTSTTPPLLTPLPPAPLPTDAEAVFDAKAGASLTAQAVMVGEVNTALNWQADSMAATAGSMTAAASSAAAAAASATAAAGSVVSAQAQVGLAGVQANNAVVSASSAQVYAAAAGAAAGLPSLTGNGKKALSVKADESGVEWKATGQVVGDILFSATPPAENYLPAAGNVYLQSAYPALFTKLSTSINIELTVPQAKAMTGGNTCFSVAYGAGKFVMATSSANMFYSFDGITWIAKAVSGGMDRVSFANGKFFAFAGGATGFAYSTDGINWTAGAMPSTANYKQVVYGNGIYVASAMNAVATSTDGVTWVLRSVPIGGSFYAINFAFGMFITMASTSAASQYITSVDGINWTIRTLPFPVKGNYNAVYGNGVMLVLGLAQTATTAGLAVLRSTDGISWAVYKLPESGIYDTLLFFGGKFAVFSLGDALTATSIDGISWSESLSLGMTPSGVVQAAASPTTVLIVNVAAAYLIQPIFSYDPATQFATPLAIPPIGTKAYIKYQE